MKIILGVTGCIGAYKSAFLIRLLQERRCEVFPVMTRSAARFITPLTLEKLSGHAVVSDLFQDESPQIEHIALARRSDLLLVAPATANCLGKFASGIADDFLSTLYLSTTTPVLVAPAMNVEMWRHPAMQENLAVLRRRGVVVVEPESGYLACGEEGEGRLADLEKIVQTALDLLGKRRTLEGRSVLVTAGPTQEDIDPVRFLSNRSSGKMGYAIAAEAADRGGRVILISGPTALEPPAGCQLVRVRSASQMADAVGERFDSADVLVMAAAVSDFRPHRQASQKIKKSSLPDVSRLDLQPTQDILVELGRRRQHQFLVGFAAESQDLEANARRKLVEKRLDLIVANDISSSDRGFGSDLNQVSILHPDGQAERFPTLTKREVAVLLWDRVEEALENRVSRTLKDGSGGAGAKA